MKTIKLIICVFILFLLSSCSSISIKEKAIIASYDVIEKIFYDIKNINEYLYNPADEILYAFLDIYKGVYDLFEEDENDTILHYRQYSGDDFFSKYIEIKEYLGKIKKYEIMNINYQYDMLPLYDYGYPYSVKIDLKIYYDNIILEEVIHGYYLKEIDRINIVSYSIKNNWTGWKKQK